MGLRVYPTGGYHRFFLGTLDVTLNSAAFTFPTTGRPLYERYGYDRLQQVEQMAATTYNYSGASHWKGPSYAAPYQFSWYLQGITPQIYSNLQTLQRRQLSTKTFIRFLDYLWPLEEDTPRTRARVGALLTPLTAGTAFFYPQFNLANFRVEEPIPWEQEGVRHKDSWTVKVTAIEADAHAPAPLIDDI